MKRKYGGTKKTTVTTRRTYKRRRTAYRRKPKITRYPIGGFGTSKVVRHRYVQEITLDPSAVSIANYRFVANGMYDPDVTGTGHQPLGFDEHASLFDKYCVIGSKLTMRFVPTTSNNAIPSYFGIMLSDEHNALAGLPKTTLFEGRLKTRPAIAGTANKDNHNVRTMKFSPKKFFNCKGNLVGNDLYSTDPNNNPQEMCYFNLWCAPIGSTNAATTTFLVTIEYLAVWSEPRIMAGS